MKKTILNFSDSGLSKKVRMMLGAFVVAFFALGLQSAQAQYLPVEDAINRLGTEIMVLHTAAPTSFAGLELDAPQSKELQKSYFKGVALEIKKTSNVQEAINVNHAGFLDRFPTASTLANGYRAEVEALLAE